MTFDWLSPKNLLIAFLLFFAVLDFYPFSYTLQIYSFLGFAAVCLAYLATRPSLSLIDEDNLKPLLFLGFWFVYNGITLFWALDKEEVMWWALYISRYAITFWVFSILFRKKEIKRLMPVIWAGIFLLYIITAIWEMTVWDHLPSSRFYGRKIWVPTGPFYGENILASFIILLLPFTVLLPLYLKKNWLFILSLALLIGSFVIITLQGARIAMLAMFAFVAYYFIRHTGWRAKVISLSVLALLVGFVVIKYKEPVEQFEEMFKHQTSTITSEASSLHMSSVQIRKQLIREAVDITVESNLLGVGGGNFEYVMSSERQFRTAWITNAHNYIMELLGNHGIILFSWFLFLYSWWLYRLWVLYRNSEGRDRYLYLMYLSSLLIFAATSVLPSSLRWNYHIWIYFAAINAMCHKTEQDREERFLPLGN